MFAALFEPLIELGRTSERNPVQPVLIAACMTAICAVVHMRERGGTAAGFRAAFADADADRMGRRRGHALPRTVLERAAGASRVWLNVFHDGFTGLTGTGLVRYDMTDAARRVAGPAVADLPLPGSSGLPPALIAGQCTSHRITGLRAGSAVSQSETLSIHGAFGPIAAASRAAGEMPCMAPGHAFGRFLAAYGLQ